jgi:sulfur-oxidizing protein SoxA
MRLGQWVGYVVWLGCSVMAVQHAPLMAQSMPSSQGQDKQPNQHVFQSGNAFLSDDLRRMQADASLNPVQLWLEQGRKLWGTDHQAGSCFSCHGASENMKAVATRYPQWSEAKRGLVNLEDQILACSQRTSSPQTNLENPDVLAISAVLQQASAGLPYQLQAKTNSTSPWQAALAAGAQQYTTRMGRMNLACTHCHDQNIGKQMRADVISPGHPTGFPIFKMSWQSMGSIERRLRACFSGVQADIPAPGSPALRQLELFLKVRAQSLTIDGPSLRR